MNLQEKMLKIMEECNKRMPKKGHNDFQHYDYVTEADVSDFFRPLFIRHNLLFTFSVDSVQKDGDTTTVIIEYQIVNAEDKNERLIFRSAGQGYDKTDKGVFKAITGSTKYALLKTFLLATGDDPEEE